MRKESTKLKKESLDTGADLAPLGRSCIEKNTSKKEGPKKTSFSVQHSPSVYFILFRWCGSVLWLGGVAWWYDLAIVGVGVWLWGEITGGSRGRRFRRDLSVHGIVCIRYINRSLFLLTLLATGLYQFFIT